MVKGGVVFVRQYNQTDRLHHATHRLEHVPVLKQSFLGDMRLFEVDAQLQVLEHDGFEHALAPVVGPFLVSEHLVQRIEGPARAADFQKF